MSAILELFNALAVLRSAGMDGQRRKSQVFHHCASSAVFLVSAALLVTARIGVQGGRPFLHSSANPGAFATRRLTRFLTLHYYFYRHLLLLLWPEPLCCDWSHSSIPLVHSPSDPRVWVSFFVIYVIPCLLVCCCLWSGFHASGAQQPSLRLVDAILQNRHECVAGFLALLALVPSSNIFFAVGFTVAERVLYIPSLGVCAAIGIVCSKVWGEEHRSNVSHPRTFVRQTASAVVLLALLGVCVERCLLQSASWKSPLALYRHGLAVNPGNEKLHDLLARTELKWSGMPGRQ